MKALRNLFKFNFSSQKGLSLTELMVSVAILGLASTAFTNVYVNGQRTYVFLQGNVKNMQIARSGIDVLSKEMRTTIQITSASDNSYSFQGDFDGNGTTDNITFTYDAVNSRITRTLNSNTTVLSQGIINIAEQPVFRYFDQDGNAITYPSSYNQAKMVKITLYVDDNPDEVPNRPIKVETSVQLRNLHERR